MQSPSFLDMLKLQHQASSSPLSKLFQSSISVPTGDATWTRVQTHVELASKELFGAHPLCQTLAVDGIMRQLKVIRSAVELLPVLCNSEDEFKSAVESLFGALQSNAISASRTVFELREGATHVVEGHASDIVQQVKTQKKRSESPLEGQEEVRVRVESKRLSKEGTSFCIAEEVRTEYEISGEGANFVENVNGKVPQQPVCEEKFDLETLIYPIEKVEKTSLSPGGILAVQKKPNLLSSHSDQDVDERKEESNNSFTTPSLSSFSEKVAMIKECFSPRAGTSKLPVTPVDKKEDEITIPDSGDASTARQKPSRTVQFALQDVFVEVKNEAKQETGSKTVLRRKSDIQGKRLQRPSSRLSEILTEDLDLDDADNVSVSSRASFASTVASNYTSYSRTSQATRHSARLAAKARSDLETNSLKPPRRSLMPKTSKPKVVHRRHTMAAPTDVTDSTFEIDPNAVSFKFSNVY
jgi:hypothetical protein